MEFFFGVAALGFVGVLVTGAILAIVNTVRLKELQRSGADLAARVAALEAKRRRPSTEVPPATAVRDVEEPELPQVSSAETERKAARGTARAAASPTASPTASSGATSPSARLDLESIIGGRWLNRIGIVAVLLAASFFLKYAFDNDWVGPAGRVSIGLLAGVGLMIASQWLLGRGYRYFSEGIAALGGGVVFLSLYAAWDFYELIPQAAAFAGMTAVTAALAALAMGRDSERLAVMALGAGLTTPALLIPGADRQITLFSYLAVLVACFLAVAWRKAWQWVAPVALIGTLFYFFGWYEEFYSSRKLLRTCLFATLFFAEFGVFLLLREALGRPLRKVELLLVPANAAWYGLSLHLMLYSDHRWWLTVAVLALGALYLAAAQLTPSRETEKTPTVRLLFAGLALTFVTAAIPIRLEGEWIVIAWALEGALLVWAGFRTDILALRAAGLVLLFVAVALLLDQGGATDRLFLNRRFAAFASVAAALAMSFYWARTRWDELRNDERTVFTAAAIATSVVAVWGLSEEVWYAMGRQPWNLDPRLARQMGLSLLWAVAASLLILVGVRRRAKLLRLQGLLLLGITVAKVFFLDLSFLDKAYRIASFLVLGVVLLLVSFWYQRSLSQQPADDRSGRSGGGEKQE